jgi:hypothetical protein
MVVEIKSTDSEEEIQRKLQAVKEEAARDQQQSADEREKRFDKYFGKWKTAIDPLELQKRWRNEWD